MRRFLIAASEACDLAEAHHESTRPEVRSRLRPVVDGPACNTGRAGVMRCERYLYTKCVLSEDALYDSYYSV